MAIPIDFTGDPPVTGDDDTGSNGVPRIPGQDPPEVIDQDYEDKVEKLRAAYWTYLDRPATDEEIDGWMSGQYGGGGIDDWVNQIQNSDEGQRYRLEEAYWEYLGRGAEDSEIKKWMSGGYGGGGIDDWVNQIQNSDEAQRHAGPGPGTGPGGPPTGVPPRTGQAPPGWNQTKWLDPEHHSDKYDAAAFLYGITNASDVQAIVESPAFQARFPGAIFNGRDRINFGDPVGWVDVLLRPSSHLEGSGGLWWGPIDDQGSGGGTAPTRPGTTGAGLGQTGAGPGPTGAGPTGGWTQPPGSPLFNPPATQGPPSMGPGGGGMMGPGGGGGTMGQMITPYNPLATYSPVPYTPPAPFRPPAYEGATPFGQDPYAAADPFTGPTAEDMAADPSYQFRLQQGQEALERSGAARGVTNTGGTLKDILDYGQQAASQEYGNVFGRQRDIYDLNERNRFNAYQANYGNAMDAYNVNERNRAGAFDRNIGTARDAYAMNEENRYRGYTTNEIARLQQNQEAENRRMGAYGTNLGAYERQQQYGLRAQGQGFDQSFRNWQQQYYQGRQNAQDTYNRMYGLGTS